MKNAIAVKSLYKSFGSLQAIKGINLEVGEGSIFALLGPNGAGKTTLIRVLTTLSLPNSGTAEVYGLDVVKQARKVRHIIGLTGQFSALDENLTGRENLELFGMLYHLSKVKSKTKARELLEFFNLTEAENRLVRTYSGGMKRRLDIAASLIANPKVLFLDEPTTGLDPKSRLALWQVIRKQASLGTTVFLTTQYLEEADQIARNIAVMDRGKIIVQGSPEKLKSIIGGNVIEVHLGNPVLLRKTIETLKQKYEKLEVDNIENKITFPAPKASQLVEVVRLLDQRKIEISDISLRKPTLDEVFLTLTKG